MNPIYMHSVNSDDGYKIIGEKVLNEMDIQIYPTDNVYYIINEDNTEENSTVQQTLSLSTSHFDSSSDFEVDINLIADSIQMLKCKFCTFICENELSIKAHCKEEHIEKFSLCVQTEINEGKKQDIIYVCGICSKSLLSLNDCQQHMILDHNFKNVTSDVENKEDNKTNITKIDYSSVSSDSKDEYWLTPKTYKEIKAKLQFNRTIRCTEKYCVYKFDTIDAMTIHKNCHSTASFTDKTATKQSLKSNHFYICTLCRKKFINWPTCSLHLWKTHSIQLDLLTCPICLSLKTHSVSKMNQHLACHWRKISNGNNCGICKTKPADSKESLSRWYAKKKCEICLKMFSNSKTLKKHIQAVHKKIKPFSCNICGHASSSKHTLQLHIRQHTGEKPYLCNICEYRTSDHNTLRRHKIKHTTIRPYKCAYCMYSSIQSIPLKLHLKSRHPGKPLPNCLHYKNNTESNDN